MAEFSTARPKVLEPFKHACWRQKQTIDDWLECLNKLLFIIEAEINDFKLTIVFQKEKKQTTLKKSARPVLIKSFVRFLHRSFANRLPFVVTPPPVVDRDQDLSISQLDSLSSLVQEVLVILYRASFLAHLAEERMSLADILAAVPDLPAIDSGLINKIISDYKLAIDNQLAGGDNAPSQLVDTTNFKINLSPDQSDRVVWDKPILKQDDQGNSILDIPPLSSQDFGHLVRLSQNLEQSLKATILIDGIGLSGPPTSPEETTLFKLAGSISQKISSRVLSEVISSGTSWVDPDFISSRIAQETIRELTWHFKQDGLNKLSNQGWLVLRSSFKKHPEVLFSRFEAAIQKTIVPKAPTEAGPAPTGPSPAPPPAQIGEFPLTETDRGGELTHQAAIEDNIVGLRVLAKAARLTKAAPTNPKDVKQIIRRQVYSQLVQAARLTKESSLDKPQLEALERVADKAANYLVYISPADPVLNLRPKQAYLELISQEPVLQDIISPEKIESTIELVGDINRKTLTSSAAPMIRSAAKLGLVEQILMRRVISKHYQSIINSGTDPTALYIGLSTPLETLQGRLDWIGGGSPINILGLSIPTAPALTEADPGFARLKSLTQQIAELNRRGILDDSDLPLIIRWLRLKNRMRQSYDDKKKAVKNIIPHNTTIILNKVKKKVGGSTVVQKILDIYQHPFVEKIVGDATDFLSVPRKTLAEKINFHLTNKSGWLQKKIETKLEADKTSFFRIFDTSEPFKKRLKLFFKGENGWFKVHIVDPSLKKHGDSSVFALGQRGLNWLQERWQGVKKSKAYKLGLKVKKKILAWQKKFKKVKDQINKIIGRVEKYIELLSPKNLLRKALVTTIRRLGQLSVKLLAKLGVKVSLSATGVGTVVAIAMLAVDFFSLFKKHWQEILSVLIGLLWYLLSNLAAFIGAVVGAGLFSVIAPFLGPAAPVIGGYLGWQVGSGIGNLISAVKSFFKGLSNWSSSIGSGAGVGPGTAIGVGVGAGTASLILVNAIISPAFLLPGEYQNTPGSKYIKVYKIAEVNDVYKKTAGPSYPMQLANLAAERSIKISYKVIIAAVDRPVTINQVQDKITIYTKDGDQVKTTNQTIELVLANTNQKPDTPIEIATENPVELVGSFRLGPKYKDSRLLNQVDVGGLVDGNQESKSDVFEVLVGDAPKSSCSQTAARSQVLTEKLYRCEAGAPPSQAPNCYCPTTNQRGYYTDTFHCGQKPPFANYLHSADPTVEDIEDNYVQCTEFVHQAFEDVFGQSTNAICSKGSPGGFLGHAGQWLSRASRFCPDQFDIIQNNGTSDPMPGDILVFSGGNEYGHVAIVSLDGSDPTGNVVRFCGANTPKKCYNIAKGQVWQSPFNSLKLVGWLRYKFCQQ